VENTETTAYEFGPFILDAKQRQLCRGDITIRIVGQQWKLLAYLVVHAPRAVPESELFDELWPGEHGDKYARLKDLYKHVRDKLRAGSQEETDWLRWSGGHLSVIPTVTPRARQQTRSSILYALTYFQDVGTSILRVIVSPGRFLTDIDERDPRSLLVRGLACFTFVVLFLAISEAQALGGFGWRFAVKRSGEFVFTFLWATAAFFVGWRLVRARISITKVLILQVYSWVGLAISAVLFFTVFGLLRDFIWTDIPRFPSSWFGFNPTSLNAIAGCVSKMPFSQCVQSSRSVQAALFGLGPVAGFFIVLLVWQIVLWIGLRRNLRIGVLRAIAAYFLFNMGSAWLITLKSAFSADANCPVTTFSTVPVFNPGPLTFEPTAFCADFPLVEVGTHESKGPVPGRRRWSNSQTEHDRGLPVNVGDIITVRIFVENSALEDSALRDRTVARHVRARAEINDVDPLRHLISVTVASDNAPTIVSSDVMHGGDAVVYGSQPTRLRYVPGSSEVSVYCEAALLKRLLDSCSDVGDKLKMVPITDGIIKNGLDLGDIEPGFRYALALFFHLIVEAGP
jgi:hypothetical protein